MNYGLQFETDIGRLYIQYGLHFQESWKLKRNKGMCVCVCVRVCVRVCVCLHANIYTS